MLDQILEKDHGQINDWVQIGSKEGKQEIILFANTPCSRNIGQDDIQTGLELNKHRSRQTLGEDVGELRCGWHMQNTYISSTDTLADEMEINLHMLRALMLNWI